MKLRYLFLLLFSYSASLALAQDNSGPRVIATFPANGSTDVDPDLKELAVTFNRAMTDKSWSWAYAIRKQFPAITGKAYYTEKLTQNHLPVKLESGKTYVIWINSKKLLNFKDKSGWPAKPFKLTFTTK